MRISNLQFAKGSIVYANFNPNGELAYLNNRPLIVVSNPIHIFNRVVICTTGTRGKPGIRVSLFNYHTGKYISDTEISTVYPNSLYSIETTSVKRCIGILDPWVMKAVDKAVAFFLGLSEEVPEYMRDFTSAYDVEYCRPKPEFIKLDEAVSQDFAAKYSSQLNTTVGFTAPPPTGNPKANVPDVQEAKVIKSLPIKNTNKKQESNSLEKEVEVMPTPIKKTKDRKPSTKVKNDMQAFIDECCIINPNLKTSADDLLRGYNHFAEEAGYQPTIASAFGKKLNSFIRKQNLEIEHVRDPFSNLYIGIGLTPAVKKDALKLTIIGGAEDNSGSTPQIYFNAEDSDEIRNWAKIPIGSVTMDSSEPLHESLALENPYTAAVIVSRWASINAVAIKCNLDLENARQLRNQLTDLAINFGQTALTKFESNPDVAKLNELDDFTRVGIVLLMATQGIGLSPKSRVKINKLVQTTEKAFHFTFTDQKKWSDINLV